MNDKFREIEKLLDPYSDTIVVQNGDEIIVATEKVERRLTVCMEVAALTASPFIGPDHIMTLDEWSKVLDSMSSEVVEHVARVLVNLSDIHRVPISPDIIDPAESPDPMAARIARRAIEQVCTATPSPIDLPAMESDTARNVLSILFGIFNGVVQNIAS